MNEKQTGRRHLLARAGLTLFGLTAGLVFAEAALWAWFAGLAWVPLRFPPGYTEDPSALHIAVLGGSTSAGLPHNEAGLPEFNLGTLAGHYLAHRLEAGTTVRVDDYAKPGWTLQQTVNQYRWKARYKPDVMVVYSGQNEICSRYSLYRRPVPRALQWLRHMYVGRIMVRTLFQREEDPANPEVHGPLFSPVTVSQQERRHYERAFRGCLSALARHCRREGIVMVVVVPESNYLYPPVRSSYNGPSARQEEARRIFFRALRHAYVEGDTPAALKDLEFLNGFCRFAALSHELGRAYLRLDMRETAIPYLRDAMDRSARPECASSEIRAIAEEVARKEGAVMVDMRNVVLHDMGRPIPDYGAYLDNVHPTMVGHAALSRRIVAELAAHGLPDDRLAPMSGNGYKEPAWLVSPQRRLTLLTIMVRSLGEEMRHSYTTLHFLEQMQRYASEASALPGSAASDIYVDAMGSYLEGSVRQERHWLQQQ